jgi:hypothetical protein
MNMFASTVTITINSVDKVLNRINDGDYSSEYYLRTSTDSFRLKLRNSTYTDKLRAGRKIDRHNIEFVHTTFAVAPATVDIVRKYYSVLENDTSDVIADDAKFAAGISAFQTEANFLKLLNWES